MYECFFAGVGRRRDEARGKEKGQKRRVAGNKYAVYAELLQLSMYGTLSTLIHLVRSVCLHRHRPSHHGVGRPIPMDGDSDAMNSSLGWWPRCKGNQCLEKGEAPVVVVVDCAVVVAVSSAYILVVSYSPSFHFSASFFSSSSFLS
jgi:hypothetical protein